ncbi:unnamed protein product [Durusdinium trenchii]|uniref:Uncharacterized protein n=2 Tax=Durusdinium trenchii TaxID=1381693 RepID=A0ABP0H573_9DINO
MVRWDGMHVNNLGTDLWVCGSVIKKLLDYDNIFGGLDMDEPDRLLLAYDMFKTWSRTNKVRHSMPKFRPWRLRSKNHPWPELQSKAYNARCVLAWLCDEVVALANSESFRDDQWMPLLASCTFHLAEWHRKTELLGRFLVPDEAMDLQRECDGCLTYYLVLSHMAVAAGVLLFPIRPKLHAFQEIALAQREDLINHRFYQGFKPEDFIGRVSTICGAGNNSNVEYIAIQRFYVGSLGFDGNLYKLHCLCVSLGFALLGAVNLSVNSGRRAMNGWGMTAPVTEPSVYLISSLLLAARAW